MSRRALTAPGMITLLLVLQFIPLVLFPAESFSFDTQEWWLPVLLAIMVLIADFQIVVRRTVSLGPWYLLGFAQGFNIISRLMMVWSHAAVQEGTVFSPNWPYLILTAIALAMSMFMLWYVEMPEVRMGFLPK